MKKVSIISLFNRSTRKFIRTYDAVFSSAELAQKKVSIIKKTYPLVICVVSKVDFYFEPDYIY